jgi:RNA polymerase sigma factor (sigma-70 family)
METSVLRHRRAALSGSRRLLAAASDDRLAEQIRRGNDIAFEVVYDRHHRGILAFCRQMLGSREEAEDAVQQTFASAYSALCSDERDIHLKAWLYTIARNRCLSILRARREQPAELDDQATAGLSEQVQRRADLRDLLDDLRELRTEQREALVLFELGDLSHAEIAGVIGVEPMKVKALVFQARSALIENREARAIPCAEIREQLATATGGALRRGPLRRHLKSCAGCREYREHVRTQRRALALLLPVVPSAGLKETVLAAIGFGGGGAGGAGLASGGAAGAAAGSAVGGGGGGLFASLAGAGGAKLAVAAAVAGGTIAGGGTAVEHAVDHHGTPAAQAAENDSARSGTRTGIGARSGTAATAPAADPNRDLASTIDVPVDDPAAEQSAPGEQPARDERKRPRGRGDGHPGDRHGAPLAGDPAHADDHPPGANGAEGPRGDGRPRGRGRGDERDGAAAPDEGRRGGDGGGPRHAQAQPQHPSEGDAADPETRAQTRPPTSGGAGEARRRGGKNGREGDGRTAADGPRGDGRDRRLLSVEHPQ